MKEVFASLYNDRAISYRVHKGFAHADVALSAGVQRMVRTRPRRRRRDVHARHRVAASSDVVFITVELRPRRDGGAGRRESRRVLRAQADAAQRQARRSSAATSARSCIRMEFATAAERAASGKLGAAPSTSPTEQRNRFSLTDADVIELAALRPDHREALRPPDGHRVGQGRHRRQALHPAGAPRDGEEPGRAGKAEQRYKLKGSRHRARRRPRHRPEDRHRPGARDRRHRRHGPRAAGRRARHRHDRPELGAGDEARRAPSSPTAAAAPAMPPSSRASWAFRRWSAAATPPSVLKDGALVTVVLRRGRHRLRLRRPARDRGDRGAARRAARHRR